MITLHQYPPAWEIPSLSPFCVKVESLLLLAKIPYQVVVENNPRKGPKGKMPFIRHNSKIVCDSSFIYDYLFKHFNCNHLAITSPSDQAIAHFLQRMLEESFYFSLLYSRWIDPVGWKSIKEHFKNFFPPLVNNLALNLIRMSLTKQAKAQGIARHSRDEVYQLGLKDIQAVEAFLNQKKFIMGQKITYLDAILFSFLITVYRQPFSSPFKEFILKKQNLTHYILRLQEIIFPNLKQSQYFTF